MYRLLLLILCIPLASQELVDVLWGNERLTNTYSYQEINQLTIEGLEDSKPISGILSLEKDAIGKGYTVLVDDRKIYKNKYFT